MVEAKNHHFCYFIFNNLTLKKFSKNHKSTTPNIIFFRCIKSLNFARQGTIFKHDIDKNKQKIRQKIITVCYRSPDTMNDYFIPNLTTILTNIHKTNKPSYIVGDMNYNIINLNHHHATQDYHALLTAHMYHQVITKPTRVTDSTATLIDHIWHNDTSIGCTTLNNTPGIIYCDISDHLPVFLHTTSH